jgi:hypothetical protein
VVVQHMPQPFKHPKSGVYYYRRVVPQSLRAALGKTEFRISLGTKDLREAKRLYLDKAAHVEAEFARAVAGPSRVATLTDAEIGRLAAIYLHQRLEEDDEALVRGSAEEDALFRDLKQQIMEVGGYTNYSDEDATTPAGLSSRAYEKKGETLQIIGDGFPS